ncbi:MAG: acyltransferase [Gemmiger sp.]
MTSFYTEEELRQIGFASLGKDVKISRKASIYGAEHMVIGNHVRVDDFCVISGAVTLGNYAHVAVGTALFAGTAGIFLGDFTGVSSRSAIYAVSDDYSGRYMPHPTIPDRYRGVTEKPVILEKHALVGTGCTILPGVTLREGTAVGAMSLVNRDTEAWSIYIGVPAKKTGDRKKDILRLEAELLQEARAEQA